MTKGTETPVVVVGAGAAGLAAARRLHEGGVAVTVVEARERIGGRIATDFTFAGTPVESGAEFIHGDRAATWQVVRAAGLHAREITREGRVAYFLNGRQLEESEFEHEPEFRTALHLEEHLAGYYGPDLSFREYAGTQGWGPLTRARAEAYIAGYDAADPEEISVLARAIQARSWRAGQGNFRILEGYSRVAETLAAGLDIRLGAIVERIQWRPAEVTLTSSDGRQFQAGKALITLPLGVLQAGSVVFDPPLPPSKQEAIAGLRMGAVVKIILSFHEPFWGEHLAFFFSDGHIPTWWPSALEPPEQAPLLTGWAGGPAALTLSRLGAENAVDQALVDLTRIFGSAPRRLFKSARFVDWPHDPFALGGYSYIPVGGLGAQVSLGSPVEETLFFAGEAAAPIGHMATVHGAIESGWRAASELLATLSTR